MTIIGETCWGKDIGKSPRMKYIWYVCSECGQQRWVKYLYGRPLFEKCNPCANHDADIHKRIGLKHRLQPRLELTSSFCYFLGAFFGDGNLYSNRKDHRIRIYAGLSECFADECYTILQSINLHPLKLLDKSWLKYGYRPQWIVQVYSINLYIWLKELNLGHLKDSISEKPLLMKAFCHGLFTAEGTIEYRGSDKHPIRLTIANTNYDLIALAKFCLQKLSYHPRLNIARKKTYKPCYQLRLSILDEIDDFGPIKAGWIARDEVDEVLS